MTNTNVAITIWWRTILLNTLFTGAWAVFKTGMVVFIVMIILVVAGFIITLPLLPLVSLLLKFQRSIPYAAHVRYTWLRAMLVLMVWLFYCGIQLIATSQWLPDDIICYAGIGTSVAVLAAAAFTRRDIVSLPSVTSPCENAPQLKTLPDV